MTETLGDRIAQARREMGVRLRRDVTRGELAASVGVDPSTVSLWESDKKSPREEALAKLAAYLGVTPAYLRYGIPTDALSPEALPEGVREGKGEIVAGRGAPSAAKAKKRA